MLKVEEQTLLGRLGVTRTLLNAATWSRLHNGKWYPGGRRRHRGTLKVLANVYGPGGTMGSY
jgi:hypothetical protein